MMINSNDVIINISENTSTNINNINNITNCNINDTVKKTSTPVLRHRLSDDHTTVAGESQSGIAGTYST
eukprot:m.203335 g.203335  ORF g.203335 m.203335 type:complete len:69 (-) comp32852_c6_seq6:32-238(-)